MSNLIDTALGIQPQALKLEAKRLELIAGNMANSDTPGYKARDIDFRATLERIAASGSDNAVTLRVTHPGHQKPPVQSPESELLYRVPNQPSLDGNTVDTQLEQGAFAEAVVRYQASLDFLNERIAGLREALRGQ